VSWLLTIGARGDIILVPSEAGSIQSAIDIARIGDEIVVAPGTYHEAIDFLGKAIVVRSSDGASVTAIDATGLNSSVVTFNRNEDLRALLEGFTITGGTGTPFGTTFRGGGVYMFGSSPTIRDCNVVENSTLKGSGSGAGIWGYNGEPSIIGCSFVGNDGGNFGGGAYFSDSVPSILNCVFVENQATRGGGIYVISCDGAVIERCQFLRNSADRGGALAISNSDQTTSSCLFVSNDCSISGAAIYTSGTTGGISLVRNCTFFGNSSPSISHSNSTISALMNCIVWNTVGGPHFGGLFVSFQHSNIEGGTNGGGNGNINLDPKFVDPLNGDFRLRSDSPCVDSGSNTLLLSDMLYDLDGHPRILDGNGDDWLVVDMGPYEHALCPTDIAPVGGNGTTGIQDLLAVIGAMGACPIPCLQSCPEDVTHNCIVNEEDLLAVIAAWGPCHGDTTNP
jgi:hypothetical protein